MKKHKFEYHLITYGIIILLYFFVMDAKAQNIPLQRLTDWSQAGLSEDIIQSTTTINFLDAGGYNDGSNLNDSILSQILAQGPTTIYFPNGEYNFTQTINLPSNTHIIGESADSTIFHFNIAEDANLINISGSLSSDTFFLANDLLRGKSSFLLYQTTGIQIGVYYKIIDNDSASITSSWAYHSTGQIIKVDSILDSKIWIAGEIRRTYHKSHQAYIQKIKPVKNVVIANITISCEKATTAQTSNIYMNYAANCHIKCIKSFKSNFAHIDIRNSTHILIEGSYFKDGWSYGNGGRGYGVVLHQSTGDSRISDNNFNHLRHSMLLQAGANGNVVSYNYSKNPYWTGVALPSNSAGDLVLHGNWPYSNLFEGNIVQNIVIDDSHGKNGPNNVFLRNRAECYGIFMNNSPASDSQIFVGNETTASGLFFGNFTLYGSGHFCYGNNQKGSVYPSGTGNITLNSLYVPSCPKYYNNWPLIGLPNSLNAHNNRAKTNLINGYLTLCSASMATDNKAIKKKSPIAIYPNPFRNIIYFSGDINQIKEIRFYDILGKRRKISVSDKELEVSNLPSGIYYVILIMNNGNHLVRQVIKQ